MIAMMKRSPHHRSDPHRRQGAMLVLVSVTLVILFVAAAFSVDVEYMYLANEQMHVAMDSAAKAAVVSLSQGSNQQTAINTAISYAAANQVCGHPLTITSSNVTLGKVTYSQSGGWVFSAGGTPLSAAPEWVEAERGCGFAIGIEPGSALLTVVFSTAPSTFF